MKQAIRTIILSAAIFAVAALVRPEYGAAQATAEWNWQTNGNYEGWTPGNDIASSSVTDGMLQVTLGGADSQLTSPAVSINAADNKQFVLQYRNGTGNGTAQLYWKTTGHGYSEAYSLPISVQTDNEWHELRVQLPASWTGTVTELRFDPSQGSSGTFEIDYMRILNTTADRYDLANGYVKLSGIYGVIDLVQFDPTGSGSYGENLLAGNLYLTASSGTNTLPGLGTAVTSTISGNTLTLSNITFGAYGTLNVTGSWVIELDGNKWSNTFTITSNANNIPLHNIGYIMPMQWYDPGFDVSVRNRVPFEYMIGGDNQYHSSYVYKRGAERTYSPAFELRQSPLYIHGANGHDYDLRIEYNQPTVEVAVGIDSMTFPFFAAEGTGSPYFKPYVLNTGETLVRELNFTVEPSSDWLPEGFPVFEGTDAAMTSALTEMFYERNYERHIGSGPTWREWMGTIRDWLQDEAWRTGEKYSMLVQRQDPDGYPWTWDNSKGWPFPGDGSDTLHHIDTPANFILGGYRYYVATGDRELLSTQIDRMRAALTYMLDYYNPTKNLFIITQSDHEGISVTENGSDYWDILPHGYIDAYSNMHGYAALTAMAELEQLVGNTARATELNGYASELKAAYDTTFWRTNHYIQTIDVNGVEHDYGPIYLNVAAFYYGLGDSAKATAFFNWAETVTTSSGEADVFSKFVFAPRATVTSNPSKAQGGWWVSAWDNYGAYGDQIQDGGAALYTTFYEIASRAQYLGANNAYGRFSEIIDRYALDHLSGGKTLYNGETVQHTYAGSVGTWGEFPESALVPVALLRGFMGIKMDKDGLQIKPNMPSSGLTQAGVTNFRYWDMNLKLTVSNSSVRLQALENESPYTDWEVNGTAVSGLFDITISLSPGGSVTLTREAGLGVNLDTIEYDTMVGWASGDYYPVSINGRGIGGHNGDDDSVRYKWPLLKGKNVITVKAVNAPGSTGGFLADFTLPDGRKIVSDASWKIRSEREDRYEGLALADGNWTQATSQGAYSSSTRGPVVNFPGGSDAHWIWDSTGQAPWLLLRKTFNWDEYWSFNYDGDEQEWGGFTHLLDREVAGGTFNAEISGNDPSMTQSINVDAAKKKRFVVRMKNGTASTTAQLYWATALSGMDESKRVDFTIVANDPNYTTYEVDLTGHLEWSGTITALRFDPATNATGTTSIDWIELKALDGDFDVADRAGISASSTYSSGWEASQAIDDDIATVWSSTAHTVNATEWIQLDLGKAHTIERVRLKPRPGGSGFPVDFKIQTSMDGATWTDVPGQVYTGYSNPGSSLETFAFSSPVTAKHVRIYATQLGQDDNNNYVFQLSELWADDKKISGSPS